MDLLQRLRPRWRHPDARIRAEAVRGLAAEDQERLETIARDDLDPQVRRVAIKRLTSPELLQLIAIDDVEPPLRELAAERARELLVGVACSSARLGEAEAAVARLSDERSLAAVALGGADEIVRQAALSRVTSERTLRDLVRNASDPAVRRAALERLTDPAALRSIAVSDCPSELALQAVARLTDPEALRAVAETRTAHKDVRRRARELLAAGAGEGTPVAFKDARARQHELCLTAESLTGERDPGRAATRLRDVQHEWEELARQVPPRDDTAARFAAACKTILEGAASVARRHAEVEHAQSALQASLDARAALCARVEALEGADASHALAEARAAWERLDPVPEERGRALARRFAQAAEACEARSEAWRVNEAYRAELAAVVAEAEALAEATAAPSPGRWRALERRWTTLVSTRGPRDDVAALEARIAAAKERSERRREEVERQQDEARQKNVARLESLCARVQDLVGMETASARAVRRDLRTIEAALQDLGPLPATERRDAWTERLSAARDELLRRLRREEETEEWRRWANAGAQEEIIQRVEQLLASNDLAEGVRQLGRLQDEWAEVASATPDKSQALWERFRAARNELRKRCDAYLAENLEKKRALCAQVAEVGDSTAWRETTELIRRVQAEWKSIGPVPAKHTRALWQQFREPCDRFFARRREHSERLDAERRENATQKTALCEQAEALADSTDWEATAAAMKRLQAEWKRVGPLPWNEAELLWQRFRAACDRFFDRRSRREEIAREESLGKAQTLVAEIESLAASLEGAEPPADDEIGRKLDESWVAWRQADLGGEEAPALRERVVRAVERIAALRPESLTGTRLDPATTRKRREKLSMRLEEIAASTSTEPRKLSLQEMALGLRERLATNTIAGSAGGASSSRQQLEQEVARIAASWAQLGPALDEAARGLEERFQRARARLRSGVAK